MVNKIRGTVYATPNQTVYVIHHSHTDIGYTDLQERVIDSQADYIRTVLELMAKPENAAFRWNCETLFCVEEFFIESQAIENIEVRNEAGEVLPCQVSPHPRGRSIRLRYRVHEGVLSLVDKATGRELLGEGFCEYCYSLWLDGEKDPEAAMDALRENCFDPYVLVIE